MIKLESFGHSNNNNINNMMNREMNSTVTDIIISPSLLDFLEQALEPFDLKKSSSNSSKIESSKYFYERSEETNEEEKIADSNQKKTGMTKAMSPTQSFESNKLQETSYFPIDVVVFVSMLPPSIRFTCLPQSTMECLLKLPSLEMVFSTSRMDGQTQNKLEHILKSNSKNFKGLKK